MDTMDNRIRTLVQLEASLKGLLVVRTRLGCAPSSHEKRDMLSAREGWSQLFTEESFVQAYNRVAHDIGVSVREINIAEDNRSAEAPSLMTMALYVPMRRAIASVQKRAVGGGIDEFVSKSTQNLDEAFNWYAYFMHLAGIPIYGKRVSSSALVHIKDSEIDEHLYFMEGGTVLAETVLHPVYLDVCVRRLDLLFYRMKINRMAAWEFESVSQRVAARAPKPEILIGLGFSKAR